MALTLTPEVEQILEQRMQEGRWASPPDVMLTALHLLDGLDELIVTSHEDFQAKIQEGLDSADRGELYTADEVRADLAEARRQRAR